MEVEEYEIKIEPHDEDENASYQFSSSMVSAVLGDGQPEAAAPVSKQEPGYSGKLDDESELDNSISNDGMPGPSNTHFQNSAETQPEMDYSDYRSAKQCSVSSCGTTGLRNNDMAFFRLPTNAYKNTAQFKSITSKMDSKTTETRSSHPSAAQLKALVEFMEVHPGLAKGFLRTQSARERARRQWEELAVHLNSLGGTYKNFKQWTKYWADKKSALKKKVAARSAAILAGGADAEDVMDLSEMEERIVALLGAMSSPGDIPLGMERFPESESANRQNQNTPAFDGIALARNLFESLSNSMGSTVSQESPALQRVAEPSAGQSPPPIKHSQTQSSLSKPTTTPSRNGNTRVISSQNASSSNTTPPPPARRVREHKARVSREYHSTSPRQIPSVVARQRRTEFSILMERLIRVEEQQLDIQRSYAQTLQSLVDSNAERETKLAEALTAMGKGLQALADAIKKDQS